MNIAVLLSGGVDSSVVVHLLCEQGYRPSLFYIKIGRDDADYMDCSAEEDLEIATAIARRYGLPLEVVDLHREYWDNVAAYAIDKIRRGLTPNPDVMCNKLIKFGCFEQRVGREFDFTATGHYATTVLREGKTWLGTAVAVSYTHLDVYKRQVLRHLTFVAAVQSDEFVHQFGRSTEQALSLIHIWATLMPRSSGDWVMI